MTIFSYYDWNIPVYYVITTTNFRQGRKWEIWHFWFDYFKYFL